MGGSPSSRSVWCPPQWTDGRSQVRRRRRTAQPSRRRRLRGEDGRTRCGLVYRSDSLHNATAAGVARLRGLDIVSVLDLRSPEEVGLLPGPLPIVHPPIQDDLERDGIDPRTLTGRAAGERLLRDLYVLLLAAAAPRYGAVLTTLSDAALLPAVVHCAGGKDRTGLAVALLLSVLGVDRETILESVDRVMRFRAESTAVPPRLDIKQSASDGPCHADSTRWPDRPWSASADGSRARGHGAGYSAGRSACPLPRLSPCCIWHRVRPGSPCRWVTLAHTTPR